MLGRLGLGATTNVQGMKDFFNAVLCEDTSEIKLCYGKLTKAEQKHVLQSGGFKEFLANIEEVDLELVKLLGGWLKQHDLLKDALQYDDFESFYRALDSGDKAMIMQIWGWLGEYRVQEQALQARKTSCLTAIASLQVAKLQDWLWERLEEFDLQEQALKSKKCRVFRVVAYENNLQYLEKIWGWLGQHTLQAKALKHKWHVVSKVVETLGYTDVLDQLEDWMGEVGINPVFIPRRPTDKDEISAMLVALRIPKMLDLAAAIKEEGTPEGKAELNKALDVCIEAVYEHLAYAGKKLKPCLEEAKYEAGRKNWGALMLKLSEALDLTSKILEGYEGRSVLLTHSLDRAATPPSIAVGGVYGSASAPAASAPAAPQISGMPQLGSAPDSAQGAGLGRG